MTTPTPTSALLGRVGRFIRFLEIRANGGTRAALGTISVVFIAMMLLCTLWSLSSPYGGSPDEPAHAAKAAGVARGQGYGLSNDEVPPEFQHPGVTAPDGTTFVPDNIRFYVIPAEYGAVREIAACAAFKSEQTPDCALEGNYDFTQDTFVHSSASLYNDTFYHLVGWPSLINTDFAGFYGMRLVNAAMTSACFSLAFGALSLLRRPTIPMAALALVATPSALYLGATVNPNGLEIATTAAFVSALGVALTRESRGRELTFLMTIAALMGALQPQIRSLGFVWLGLAVLALLILFGYKRFFSLILRPQSLIAVLVTVTGIALAIWQVMSTSVLTATVPLRGHGAPVLEGMRMMLERIGDQMTSMVSLFGWIDTPGPSYIMFAYVTFAFGLVLTALTLSGRRTVFAVLFALMSYIFVPALIQGVSMKTSGFIWQGRYSMAIFAVLLLISGFALNEKWDHIPSRFATRWLLIFTFGIGGIHLASLYTALHRYAVGTNGSHRKFLTDPTWLPPLPIGSLIWVAAFFIASAIYTFTLLRIMRGVQITDNAARPLETASLSVANRAEIQANTA